ncbi:MAG: hypothetical protein A3F72_06605 [Bacteroidetes bacterium RIFCSPLOWO2_12_FULL_35_15]|nr:MAG: hypothetical protein A3F72_06605 [Bacteroidetes bacterium RIFCSPLOWO2_12_FULL_35_15]
MHDLKQLKIIIISFFVLNVQLLSAQTKVLSNAHSHNDYKQKHPLTDALNNGFSSIEVDVFLKNNKLIVSHIYPFFKKGTLETLYLKALQDSTIKHQGPVYATNNLPIILLVDIKTDAAKTYLLLESTLEKYRSILTSYENGKIIQRSVTVIITGNKPLDEMKKEVIRFAFIDENLLNIENKNSSEIYLMASTKYSNLLKWNGKGKIPEQEKQKLLQFVSLAHQQGKKIRLWASPENKNVWKELLNCGVDYINTDKLKELHDFLISRKTETN